MESFAFSIKKLGRSYPTESDYQVVFQNWACYGIYPSYKIYELDGKSKLHSHGVVLVPKGFFLKKLDFFGFHVYKTPITYLDGWIEYCNKNQKGLKEINK